MAEQAVVSMIEALVETPTVSSDSNLALIDNVQAYLADQGIASHLVPNGDGMKSNLYATIGPAEPGGVVLSAHTDVVPVEGQAWSSDPFRLRERGGRLYGRGTADMKSFAAIALALVPEMREAGLKRPIHLALSYDEEPGCFGAPDMIADMVKTVPKPSAVIVGEPTEMRVVTAHKGFLNFETSVTGHSVHSSQADRGVSAIVTAARLIIWLDDRMRENAGRPPDPLFDPPYTTLHSGTIAGGTAHNIVAKTCRFVTDIRTVPGEDPLDWLARYRAHIDLDVMPAMRAIAPAAGVAVNTIAHVPGLRPERDGAAEGLARRLTGDNGTHVVAYGTEAGQFQDAGYSVVVCGPGSIDQAHQPDEYIALSEVEKGTAFVRALIRDLAS